MNADPEVLLYPSFYGKLHEIMRIDDKGITYRRSIMIPWSDIVAYRAFPDFLFDLVEAFVRSARPRVCLYLRGGDRLCVRGDLLRRASSPPSQRSAGFDYLVGALHARGIQKWQGPREEVIQLGTAWSLLLIGAAGGVAYTRAAATGWSLPAAAITAGVLLAQLAFVVAPLIARRARRIYMRTLVSSSQ